MLSDKPNPLIPKVSVKSPKSCASPADAIVIKLITLLLDDGAVAQLIIPLVGEAHPLGLFTAAVKSPKSVASPSVGIVTNSIVLTGLGSFPPANIPRV